MQFVSVDKIGHIKMDTEYLSDIENFQCTPPDFVEGVTATTLNLLPKKSEEKYLKEYSIFKECSNGKKVGKPSENVMLVYFYEKAKTYKSSSLWSKYSMLKTTLMVYDSINIKFPKLVAFLKRESANYRPKKSQIFSRDDINSFLVKAPDDMYLCIKVCIIMIIVVCIK